MTELLRHEISDSLSLAYRLRPGRGPTLIFLPGYGSDMLGSKACAIDAWAETDGRALLRFDYAGCGESDGAFEAQDLRSWRGDVLAMIDEVAPPGPVVLVGSSMGGWLMLHAALARPDRVAALVGIAAAPDFTSWGFTTEQKMEILREGRLVAEPVGEDPPLVTTRGFWESGEAMRLLHGPLDIDGPVRLLHGQQDEEVAWTWSLEIMNRLRSADVQTCLVKDGDHRLSRASDLVLITGTLSQLMETL
jgi:alpha-beta hydrolase superfamily lysophospholipase